MLHDEDRDDFYKELALVAVPALIAIIPSILEFAKGDKDTDAKKKKDVKADSFQAYVAERKR
jgi:hypothetical protein